MEIPISEIISNCAIATFKVLLLCLGGVTLARKGILSNTEIRAMSKVAQDLFIPALIFSNFVSVNFSQIVSYSPVILISIATIFLGIYIGKLVSKYIIKDEEYTVLSPIVCGFAHTLNIQLSMVETLAPLLTKIEVLINKTYDLDAESRGVIFVMITTIVNTILRWSLMTKLIKEHEKDYKPSVGEKKSLEMKLLNNKQEIQSKGTESHESNIVSSWWKNLQEILNAPLIVAFLSIFLAMIPPLQNLFLSETSLVYQLFTRSTKFVGRASSPVLLVLLGANIGGTQSGEGRTPLKVVGTITAAKMVAMPVLGFIFVIILQSLSLLEDPTMLMVILATFGAPTANNLLIQYASLGKEMGAVSRVVLATYIFSALVLPVVLIIFFSGYTLE